MKNSPNCEFCDELQGLNPSRFAQLYKEMVSSRIVAESKHFVALPTMGQLFTGSMLVIPVSHEETCASLPKSRRDELLQFVTEISRSMAQFGHPIIFEHGAMACSGGGCGIYHAHMHIVPLPEIIDPEILLPDQNAKVGSFYRALCDLGNSESYLLVSNDRSTVYVDLESTDKEYPSQHIRRVIVERYDLEKSWDWRTYTKIEPEIISTISRFG